jgi:mono/diheme cytochrome c family protein
MSTRFFAASAAVALAGIVATAAPQSAPARPVPPAASRPASTAVPERAVVDRYCVGCHNARAKAGNLNLQGLDTAHPADNAETWEKVVRKLRNGLMPPTGAARPDEATYHTFLTTLQTALDQAAAADPNPGRTETVHRLNRIEYVNAVRDLLGVEMAEDLLPADDSSYGFDNIAGVLKMSPALMERYLAAAKVVSRAAVGGAPPVPATAIYRVSPETEQHDRIEDLPFGTRGGTLIRHDFPLDAQYDIKITVSSYRGGGEPQELEVAIDGARVKLFTVSPRTQPELRVPVKGGPHDVTVAFLRRAPDLIEQVREPFLNPEAPSGTGGGPTGLLPSVASVTIAGPFEATGAGDTPSRRRVFVCAPKRPADEAPAASAKAPARSRRSSLETQASEDGCAKTILSGLARRAYRGNSTPDNVRVLLDFYQKERTDGGTFDSGIEFAIRRMLVSPEFLYRVEADPVARVAPRTAPISNPAGSSSNYRISDLELASRLSFFLWSSIPDDELLDVAARGGLKDPAMLEKQVRRMLADPRSEVLMRNFGGQWLLVRNMASVRPGESYALTFDETLRHAMQRETELFLDSVMRENRGVMELLTADYTFVNERLAQHYGIANVQGSNFRRVALPADSPRRGLLGHASILTVTSPAIRTSPVIRGKWILNNILGSPPPDPPPNVPALSDQKTQARVKTMRERMSQHRANPMCASCHNMIDPAGFALENFDAIGRWRLYDDSYNRIDASGALPDGSAFKDVNGLRTALTAHPERFVNTFAEKLLTYALGRGLEYYDMPAVRKILADTAADNYRMQSIILGVVKSYPFQYRRVEAAQRPAPAAANQ